jgi:phage terminase Nu1 subunit (DNA packaging protein)
MTTRRLVLDLDEIAELFGVAEKTIRSWISAGLPVEVQGRQGRGQKTRLDLAGTVRWYHATHHEKHELDRTRARLNRAMAELAELRAGASRGDLVSLSAVGREFGALLSTVRTNALAIPAKLAPELEGQTTVERQATLEHAMNDLLDHCANWRPGGGR